MTDAETNCGKVASLMAILSGEAPIESGVALLAADVVFHVDGWRFQGINVWANWIRYTRTRGRVTDPKVVVDEIVTEPDGTVTVRGRWTGMRRGRQLNSKPCSARYRFADGRIVEAWSTRHNYAFLCGSYLWCPLGFAVQLLFASWWKARTPQLDLTGGVGAPQVSFLSPATGVLAAAD